MATQQNCEAALDEHEDRLSALPNVVGLGITSLDEANPEYQDLAVAVYVSQILPKDQLEPFELIPKTVQIMKDNALEDVPVRIIEQGIVSLESDEDDSEFSIEPL